MDLRNATNRELHSLLRRRGRVHSWRFDRLADAAATELDMRRKDHTLADLVCLFAYGGVDYWKEIQAVHRSGKERLTIPDLKEIIAAANSYDPFIQDEALALLNQLARERSAAS